MNRSPGLAGVLSVLFPGLGHLYGGATTRAVALAAVFFALIQSMSYAGHGLLVLPLLGIWLFGILDAIRVTEETVRARAEGRTAEVGLDRRWAIGLVLVGAVATLTIIPGLGWAVRLWPLALLWIGYQLLRGRPVLPDFLNPAVEQDKRAPAPGNRPPAGPAADVALAAAGSRRAGDPAGKPPAGKE